MPCAKTSYGIKIVKVGPPVFFKIGPPVFFLHSSPFYPVPKILCFTMLFNWPDSPKVPLPMVGSISPCNTCSMDPPDSAFQTAYWSVQPRFRPAHGCTLQCASKCD